MRCSLFALPIFGICLVIQLSNSQIICDKNDYTVVYSNGTFKRCLSCGKCHEGYGLYPPCGSKLFHPPMSECRSCKAQTFSREYDSSSCKACHQCAEHEIKEAECTNKSDTLCSRKCEQGYFMSKTVHNCLECSACCSDGRDEKIKECVSLGIKNKECSPRPDKTCAGQPPNTDATKGSRGLAMKYLIVIIVVTIVVAIAVVIVIVMVCLRKKRNIRSSVQKPEAPAAKQRNGSVSIVTGPQTELPVVTVEPNALAASNPIFEGTPELDTKKPKPTVVGAVGGTPLQDMAAKETQKPKDSNSNVRKPSVSRQGSQDSHNGGEHRKRSFSLKSITSYKRDDSLIESEEVQGVETHEAIKIINHPQSQTVKEGSKVQLECKLEKKSQHFLYQWYRDDGSAVIGKSESVLVLDQVELKDFGSYHCRVSYEDSFGEGEVTNPAKLEVKPIPGRNGKRLKCLSDVDYSTMDCVATLLGSEKPGLGDWRGIGFNYGMEAYQIDALVNEAPVKRGRMVLEYLQTSKPNLTVFDFCRTLKEDTFKRFDIVKKLENHFLVSI